jgi:hypothetical protein
MKDRVRDTLGKELEIDYGSVETDDDFDQELQALEADHVRDQGDLPGENLNVSRSNIWVASTSFHSRPS